MIDVDADDFDPADMDHPCHDHHAPDGHGNAEDHGADHTHPDTPFDHHDHSLEASAAGDQPGVEVTLDHFDPGHEGEDVIGTPAGDMTHWHAQHYHDSCTISCEEFILDAVTGRDFQEQDLAREAIAHGWYKPGAGTPPLHVGALLEAHGVAVYREFGCRLDDLAEQLRQGERVIVSVHSDTLRSDGDDENRPLDGYLGMPNQVANHAVEVIGIKDAGTDHAMLILNDPGMREGQGVMVLAEQFEHAWAFSGHYMVATQLHNPQPPEHDQPFLGGYYNANGTYHADSRQAAPW